MPDHGEDGVGPIRRKKVGDRGKALVAPRLFLKKAHGRERIQQDGHGAQIPRQPPGHFRCGERLGTEEGKKIQFGGRQEDPAFHKIARQPQNGFDG